MAIKQLRVAVELFLSSKAVNNLVDKLVNDCKDILKHVPGPDVGIATNDHEDLENDSKESEMIETAINRSKCNYLKHLV